MNYVLKVAPKNQSPACFACTRKRLCTRRIRDKCQAAQSQSCSNYAATVSLLHSVPPSLVFPLTANEFSFRSSELPLLKVYY